MGMLNRVPINIQVALFSNESRACMYILYITGPCYGMVLSIDWTSCHVALVVLLCPIWQSCAPLILRGTVCPSIAPFDHPPFLPTHSSPPSSLLLSLPPLSSSTSSLFSCTSSLSSLFSLSLSSLSLSL